MDELEVEAGESEAGVRARLAVVLPELAELPLVLNDHLPGSDPHWWASSAIIDGRFVAKFAWSEEAAVRVRREARLLGALAAARADLQLPELVGASDEPALLVTRRIAGGPLWFDPRRPPTATVIERVAASLAAFLARLHGPRTLAAAEQAVKLVAPEPQADTAALRDRFAPRLSTQRTQWVLACCDWVDDVLARDPPERVLLHGDLHGFNQIWDTDTWQLRAVVDLEVAGPGDPNYDLRYLPDLAPGLTLLRAIIHHYQPATQRPVDIERVIAWHVRTVLGDALWRTEAGIDLPGGGTPTAWVDGLHDRFALLGIEA